jgi:hypothetical protein
VRQTVVGKEAAERRKRKCWLAIGKRLEDDLDAFVAVVVLVPGRGAVALFAQGRERVLGRGSESRSVT